MYIKRGGQFVLFCGHLKCTIKREIIRWCRLTNILPVRLRNQQIWFLNQNHNTIKPIKNWRFCIFCPKIYIIHNMKLFCQKKSDQQILKLDISNQSSENWGIFLKISKLHCSLYLFTRKDVPLDWFKMSCFNICWSDFFWKKRFILWII